MPDDNNSDNNKTPITTTYDLSTTEDAKRFAFLTEKYIIGREVIALIVRTDRVEVHMDSGKVLSFQIDGPDIAVAIHGIPSVPGLDDGPGGLVN